MSIYAIGDIQGCFDELMSLLSEIRFRPSQDRLWFCGDLVNRGPRSLDVLRFVADLGAHAITVLGNHDLNMLAVAAGTRPLRGKDTFQDVLEAPDRDELLGWVRAWPMLHHDPDLGFALVHAGVPPAWDLRTARRCASEVETQLSSADYVAFLQHMYGAIPDTWSEQLTGYARLRFITNGLTRIRYCDRSGRLLLEDSSPPGTQDPGWIPWFEVPQRQNAGVPILFGHWSTLQLHKPVEPLHQVYHLDFGCVWGRQLTAMRLEDGRYFTVPCPDTYPGS